MYTYVYILYIYVCVLLHERLIKLFILQRDSYYIASYVLQCHDGCIVCKPWHPQSY